MEPVHRLEVLLAELKEEIKYSESIIQGLNHGLVVSGPDGTIERSNSRAKAILCPFCKSLDGENFFTLIGPQASEIIYNSIDVYKGGEEREIILSLNGDEKKDIRYSIVPREDTRGRHVGFVISLSDISELKYVRKEMEKMNRLTTVAEIASAVAHEVRNPLAGIKIMAQSLEEDCLTLEEKSECSKRIARQVDRLNDILTDFFSYARPTTPQVSSISLIDILAETQPLIKNKLSMNYIEVQEGHQENLPNIIADPGQVQQVLLNLFLNSIDAIRQGGIIEIDTRLISRSDLLRNKRKYPGLLSDKAYVCMQFTDNGTGMIPDVSEQVFEPFFTTKNSGIGMGLSIVYRTLKENDAAITVDSQEGKGTTFTIFFKADE